MELKRAFYDFLVQWKGEHVRQCLLVNGARQIGKTYIIEKFGRENYESFIEINFALDPQCIDIFECFHLQPFFKMLSDNVVVNVRVQIP